MNDENTFGCDECNADDVPLNQLHRSDVINSDLCFCSETCRDKYDLRIIKDREQRQLYQAAPEVLSALKGLLDANRRLDVQTASINDVGELADAESAAIKAIAKAEGK
jgi:hypothetical protein